MPNTTLVQGDPVTWIHRTLSGHDARGNDTYTSTSTVINACAISYGISTEIVEGTDTVASDVIVYLPDDALGITAYDQLILPDGKTYQVQGNPIQDASPFSGITSYIAAHARQVAGSTA